ncbi:MAG: hypothetical protein ACK4GC_01905 [Paracoccaceae bacterium]
MMIVRTRVFAALVACLPTLAIAGDNNLVDLLQFSTGPVGNTLTLDQSKASGSRLVGGPLALGPASQIGEDNSAIITDTGEDNLVVLNQGSFLTPGTSNSAEILVSGNDASANIQQFGAGNTGVLRVESLDALLPASGSILQAGNLNFATLTVSGENASGSLNQIGNSNENELSVQGPNANVVFTQFGNNNVNLNENANPSPIRVFTNAGTVYITQYSF